MMGKNSSGQHKFFTFPVLSQEYSLTFEVMCKNLLPEPQSLIDKFHDSCGKAISEVFQTPGSTLKSPGTKTVFIPCH